MGQPPLSRGVNFQKSSLQRFRTNRFQSIREFSTGTSKPASVEAVRWVGSIKQLCVSPPFVPVFPGCPVHVAS